ncbi:MAG: YggS family pyridoxal phosphate-dependent enzyme [Rhodospirillales bacterium]
MVENADASVDVVANLRAVEARIAEAAGAAGRDPADVSLVAVTKVHGPDRIRPAIEAGHRTFGENRVQEAEGKWPAMRDLSPDIRLHLIGPLQSNKVKAALETFDVIETVDRPKLARRIAGLMDETGRRPDVFVQVNTGAEPQKAGVLPEDADAFVALCRDDLGLPVVGLMCIPPVDEEPSLHFALLAKIAARNGLTGLSMGMSADFEVAVRFGATHVRVGSAIFGERPKPAG